ncbi:hypothetical protein M501DRAFT_993442 [Patellaria atrata CBS 101060]|uniref:dolichol kinase n=1 Tax=Patellaria atrata CBS 101060 TaxID=1346257 RepID=A0A9P4VV64_9PEZI|nr:hypothetical protein M501DRAFT_993442 [Patellaria atrata CBS 101060]
MSQNTEIPSKILAPKPYMLKLPPGGLDPEIIVSLYALHQALLPPLRYLTATSLLPAELQLLSISLVNLLLFAESPQMIILSTLIWVGALCLFAFGGSVLRYGVALARVPKWKLKRAGNIVKNRESFIRLLTSSLKRDFSVATGWSPPSSAQHSLPESSADESSPYHTHKQNSSLQIQVSDIKSALKGAFERETNSATEQIQEPFILPNNAPSPSSIRRRNTLPAVLKKSLSPQRRLRRRNTSKSGAQQYFLSLTPEQANKKKWIYAIYIYLVMIAIVLGPLRLIISKYAVFGADPFGWAIGYLFGNLRPVRFRIVDMNLDDWIPLPPLQNFPFIFSLQSLRILTIPSLRSLLGAANIRLVLIAYHLIILIAGLTTVLRIPKNFEVDTRRKVFHGMMVAMFLPTTFVDPAFASLALALALVAFLLLDLLRASQLPPLSKPLAAFLTPYVDGRDLRGPVVISHMFLLIGCAIPLWLSLAASTLEGDDPWQGWEVKERDIGMIAGVVCVGMGDAAASLIGRRYGRRKWPWTGGKSLEGSAAFAIAVTVGLVAAKLWLKLGRWDNAGLGQQGWPVVVGKAGASAVAASFCEAVLTGGNDNVVVPVVLWLVVRGVGL